MSSYPQDLRYTPTHEWVRVEDDDTISVGITDHAQNLLGDLVFVELPKLDKAVHAGKEVAVVESVKTAADVYAPVSGTVVAINEALQNTPGQVNIDPYGTGWLFRIKMADKTELTKLLDAQKYQNTFESE